MDILLASIAAKKADYDRLRQEKPADALTGREHTHDIELTCSSNASRRGVNGRVARTPRAKSPPPIK